jgi:hypothetical protein
MKRCTFVGLLGGPAAPTRHPPARPLGTGAVQRQRSCALRFGDRPSRG